MHLGREQRLSMCSSPAAHVGGQDGVYNSGLSLAGPDCCGLPGGEPARDQRKGITLSICLPKKLISQSFDKRHRTELESLRLIDPCFQN